MPKDPPRGWSDLVGHRRYGYDSQRPESRRALAQFIAGAGITVVEGDLSTLSVNALRLNTFFVARMTAAQLHVSWTRDRIPARSRYLYLFVNQGMVEFLGDAERVVADGGGLCIVLPGRVPVEFRILGPTEMIFFTFDEREILPLSLSQSNAGSLSRSSTVFRGAYAYLQAITAPQSEESDGESLVLRTLTRDVARAVIAEAAVRRKVDPLFETAQLVIAERALDSRFTIDDLARACGVSRRTIYRVYADHSTSPSEELRRKRLERALDVLENNPGTSLAGVAAASGFGSVSTLERAFRTVRGVSPRVATRAQTSGS
ncbi:AraC-like DNA-binding protein [Microbacterium resistens]|uniref:AraC-like DNA-binding protein n=1 Tax=Microbacterium resistens TaxID=156977 RepID=A0ABU1SEA3_9MICO|nr:helix-turn-helix domain-containing protein [Microbacterium resistens]MDR6867943.1 AraC-like DNA-binding protein [Microbacterium resistens]